MRHLRGSKDDLIDVFFYQVDQRGVAVCNLYSEADDFAQHFVQCSLRTDDTGNSVQQRDLRSLWFVHIVEAHSFMLGSLESLNNSIFLSARFIANDFQATTELTKEREMPLQNRVTPFSEIERSPARGLFTGNRGILHNEAQELVTTRWRHKAWIVCELEYKGWRRTLMQPNRWTELFFLDEATAFAAGHRPCGLCRRDAYKLFLKLSGFASAKALDAALHEERTKLPPEIELSKLPASAMFENRGKAYLKREEGVCEWSHFRYSGLVAMEGQTLVRPLTPNLTRLVVAAGYPLLYPSAVVVARA